MYQGIGGYFCDNIVNPEFVYIVIVTITYEKPSYSIFASS